MHGVSEDNDWHANDFVAVKGTRAFSGTLRDCLQIVFLVKQVN